jgi:hypothetical protein
MNKIIVSMKVPLDSETARLVRIHLASEKINNLVYVASLIEKDIEARRPELLRIGEPREGGM